MMIEVCGHRVLLKPKDVEKVTKGGIYIPDTIAEKERLATTVGRVVGIGPTAWYDFPGEPWCKVGDLVMYGKYGGKMVDAPDGNKYVLINDEDCLAIVSEEDYKDNE